ncbi:hypothetical protein QTH97_32005 [Variovorax sp. J22R24]|uniref:hypothetical protein n=1 Tax=Variovorax gracilis TaxID=3053502 RepID=UPI002574E39A|nr:hypothetical protein [Variovorax sp. J22R24]MDM0109586.1 hypothetical protein [Variovorax sp. J22R24]
MADTSFEHHGNQVEIKAWQAENRWASSFQFDDRLPVKNVQTGARSEEQALIEARHEAIATIKAVRNGP